LVTWHKAGLWDVENINGILKRMLCEPYAKAFLQSQQVLKNNFIVRKTTEKVLMENFL